MALVKEHTFPQAVRDVQVGLCYSPTHCIIIAVKGQWSRIHCEDEKPMSALCFFFPEHTGH